MRKVTLYMLLFLSATLYGQRMHLEIGANLEFNDVFFDQPTWINQSKFTEIHSIGLNGLIRVSKRKFGTQLNIGFTKAIDQFVRMNDGNASTKYINLNTIPIGLLEHFYLVKKPEKKLDLQMGFINSFCLNGFTYLPNKTQMNKWQLSARGAINYTYHTFICGVYYDYPVRSQFADYRPTALFGASIGLIY